jgi:hypothetical protein
MAVVNAAFPQGALNNNQQLNLNGFQNLAGAGGASYGGSGYGAATDLSGLGAGGGYGSSSYESSSYESSTAGALGGNLAYAGAGAGLGGAGYGGSSYESSSYNSSVGNAGGDLAYGGAVGLTGTDLSAANYSSSSQTTAVQQYATDAQGLFRDSNPQIIRRPAPGGNVTYTQNIRVRFLQPPPVPPPGVSFLSFFSCL